jgi:hypothetical protein
VEPHSLAIIAAFFTQLKWNSVGAFLIDRAQKNQNRWLSWISKETPWVTNAAHFVVAAFTAVGIHATYNPASRFIGIQLPMASAAILAIGQIAQNYAMQHGWAKLFGLDLSSLQTLAKMAFGVGTGVPASAVMGPGAGPQPGGQAKP